MRIAGGEFRGRVLLVPKSGEIRPTQDRVREALFSMLMNAVPGADFLDLFAGSGAVGFEALSRGAKSAVFVERNPRHADIIAKNAATLLGNACASAASVIRADAYAFIERYSGSGFDIVFADPPYALGDERGYDGVLDTLARRGVVRPGGIFVAETAANTALAEPPGWTLLRDRTYGKSRIAMWRRALSSSSPDSQEGAES